MIPSSSRTELEGIDGLQALLGQEIGVSAWRTISQEEVDAFASLTGDDQWIHVDVARAQAGPFGGTIVHGYLILSFAPALAAEVYEVTGFPHALNYGLGKVRFPSVLPVGDPVRLRVTLTALERVPGGVRTEFLQVFERDGAPKPVAVVTKLTQFMDPVESG
jgi:acyl dehydratase